VVASSGRRARPHRIARESWGFRRSACFSAPVHLGGFRLS
jgi:hypothetical protein